MTKVGKIKLDKTSRMTKQYFVSQNKNTVFQSSGHRLRSQIEQARLENKYDWVRCGFVITMIQFDLRSEINLAHLAIRFVQTYTIDEY